MRTLLATVGTRGDVQPLLALALGLRARGHDVVLCAPARFRAWIEGRGLPYAEVGVDPEEMLRAEKSLRKLRALVRADAARQFEVLARAAEGAEAVVGAPVILAAQAIAERRGIPFFSAVYCPQTLPSREHPFPALAAMRLPRWANWASWQLGTRVYGWVTLGMLNELRGELGLSPDRSPVRHMFGDDILLASDPAFGCATGPLARGVTHTGAWMDEGDALPAELQAFLAAGPSPVFLGFGSNLEGERERTVAAMVEGLKRAGVRGVIGGEAPSGAPTSSDVYFCGATSHARLFPRCALIVHHGGAGTTHAAAVAGRPQWIVAHRGDQHWWASRVTELGLGPAATVRRKFSAEALASAIREAAGTPGLEARCRAFAAPMQRDGVERAIDELEGRVASAPARARAAPAPAR